MGDVPDSPGIYAFTVQRQADHPVTRVVYVGMTTHLWMVTKGFLPRGGGARGGQRYGRPIHAGATRTRINLEIARASRKGWTVRHWVRPFAVPIGMDVTTALRDQEEELIRRWKLRSTGWNVG